MMIRYCLDMSAHEVDDSVDHRGRIVCASSSREMWKFARADSGVVNVDDDGKVDMEILRLGIVPGKPL